MMDEWVKIFDKLKSKEIKTIQAELNGVMGGGTGGLKEFKAGRRSKPKIWSMGADRWEREGIMIIPTGEAKKRTAANAFRLWKSTNLNTGKASIMASVGNMGLNIERLVSWSVLDVQVDIEREDYPDPLCTFKIMIDDEPFQLDEWLNADNTLERKDSHIKVCQPELFKQVAEVLSFSDDELWSVLEEAVKNEVGNE